MSVETISSTRVKARKDHRCLCCETVAIKAGEQYRRDVLAYDGRVYTWITCADCDVIYMDVWRWAGGNYLEDGIGADDFLSWAAENASEDQRAAAYLARTVGVPARGEDGER